MKNLTFLFLFLFLTVGVFAQNSRGDRNSPLEASETKALLNVYVTDFDESPLPNEIVIFTSVRSGKSVRRKTNSEGRFAILLPEGDSYKIKYENLVEDREYKTIEIPSRPGYMEADLRVMLKPVEDEVFELDIHFKTAEAIILEISFQNLDHLARKMEEKPEMQIEVAGHTDAVGSAATNQVLSEKRAEAVKTYLTQKGIDPTRISTVGYGEKIPILANDTEAGRAHNRRTEIRVISN